jgi:hypothetical protein
MNGLQRLSALISVAAGIVGAFYVVGLAVEGLRLMAYGLPIETVVSQLPQPLVAITGLTEIGMPVAVVAVVYLLARLLTQHLRSTRMSGILAAHVRLADAEVGAAVVLTWIVLAIGRVLKHQLWSPTLFTLSFVALLGSVGIAVATLGLYREWAHAPNGFAGRALAGFQVPASWSNALWATTAVCLATIPLFLLNGATLALPDARLCPTTATALPVSGWLVGATTDRYYLGAASSEAGPRYILAVPTNNVTLLEGSAELKLLGSDSKPNPAAAATCPALPSPAVSPSPSHPQ